MLTWNVIYGNFNSREIEIYNIFRHWAFKQDCVKAAKKFMDNKESFADEVRKSLMYYFWSKCEWEVIVQHWPNNERFHDKKIDVYSQVMMNWDIFIDYLWEHRKELKIENGTKG